MKHEIEIREIEPIRVAYMKYNGIAAEANKVFPNVFKAIMGKSNGAPFFMYYNMDREKGIGEMELCVPTVEEPLGNGILVKETPRVKALFATHFGSYKSLFEAYAEMDEYAEKNKIELCMPIREVFVKGPGMIFKGNQDKYITEIIFPIKEK
ncbi:MAG: GyrI-like domain-containing protein [Anaeroplasmataceae bacterium]|nr:GyrI-like domain-containing protein [Anaeroplasmataceae bacterium]